jgi:hypothetical protein
MNIKMNEMWKIYVLKVFYFFSVHSPTPPFLIGMSFDQYKKM